MSTSWEDIMAQKVPAIKQAGKKVASPAVDEKILLGMYRNVYATRQFELQVYRIVPTGFIRGYLHLYLGEEAVAAGACASLEADDYIVSTHRGHGHCISKGADLKLMAAEIMGKATGYCGGRGGSMHISSKADKQPRREWSCRRRDPDRMRGRHGNQS